MNNADGIGFSALWAQLEASAATDGARWWLIRCRPTPGRSLIAAREAGVGRRALLLPLDGAQPPAHRQWPRLSALIPVSILVDGAPQIGVILAEPRFADVFDALAVDLARRVEEAASADGAVVALLGQLHRWQRFLTVGVQVLDPSAQRGLWGELHFLHTNLIAALGPADAVAAWTGPKGAHQDFQAASVWVEVKTTLAKQPQAVRITSERQLDDGHAPALFLHVLSLESQEAGVDTLPSRVAALRDALAGAPGARENFEDALLSAGYLDRDGARYASPGYALRCADTYHVCAGFPRIVESGLPVGVGSVSYDLALAACAGFAVAPEALHAAISKPESASRP
jgi:hypothetical protein